LYDSAGNALNDVNMYHITDDAIYNDPLLKCKYIATKTPTTICIASTIGKLEMYAAEAF